VIGATIVAASSSAVKWHNLFQDVTTLASSLVNWSALWKIIVTTSAAPAW
jgi:hypothetical protein